MKKPGNAQAPIDPVASFSDRPTIYLVNPRSGSNVAGLTECIDLLGYRYLCANLSLPTLAAMVDESKFKIEICDENVDTVDFDLPCDIVGLTIYQNLKSDVRRDVALLHSYGIDVAAGIVVGFDDDDSLIFRRQAAFLQELSIPVSFAGMLLTPDGTELKERLIKEGRYLGGDRVKGHTCDTNVHPGHMTVEQLRNGYFWMMNQLYDERHFRERVQGALARYPEPSALARRYRPREMRNPSKFVSVMARLLGYYFAGGSAMRWMLWRYLLVTLKHRSHAAVAIYWLISFKHFRELLIRNGVYKNVRFEDDNHENRHVDECQHAATA